MQLRPSGTPVDLSKAIACQMLKDTTRTDIIDSPNFTDDIEIEVCQSDGKGTYRLRQTL